MTRHTSPSYIVFAHSALALLVGALLFEPSLGIAQSSSGQGTQAARPSSYPKLSGAAAKNFNLALNLMSRLGDKEMADNLQQHASDGKIDASKLGAAEGGEASQATGQITIANSVITPLKTSPNQKPLDPDKAVHVDFIVRLSATLVHEYTHTKQSVSSWVSSSWSNKTGGAHPAEVEAWNAALASLNRWARKENENLEAAQKSGKDPKELARIARRVKGFINVYRSLLSDFIDNKYGRPVRWLTEDGTFLKGDERIRHLKRRSAELDAVINPPPPPPKPKTATSPSLADAVSQAISDLDAKYPRVEPRSAAGVELMPELDPAELQREQNVLQGNQPNVSAPDSNFQIRIESVPSQ